MKETTPTAMPPCFDKWCRRQRRYFYPQSSKSGFRHYLGGLWGARARKNLTGFSKDTVGVTYHPLHHFLTPASGNAELVNQRRWEVMQPCSQTKIRRGFTLIIDDFCHRKSGKSTAGVGRQYIGFQCKTDKGIVLVTTHLLDGVKSWRLDVSLYQHASSLPQGKQAPEYIKKPDIALKLIDKCLERGEQPGVVVMDAGYGNKSKFGQELESRKLRYIGGLAKNRKVLV